MNIRATFDPKTDKFHLIYDEAAKSIFADASRMIFTCFLEGTYASCHEFSDELNEDLAQGSRLLAQFGGSSRRSVDTNSENLDSALLVVCWAILRLVKARQSISPLQQVLTVLSSVTPIYFPAYLLPPTDEVLSRQKTPAEVWDDYETLRSWNKPDLPFLFVTQAHDLFLALRSVVCPAAEFKELVDNLDASLYLLRLAIKAADCAKSATHPKDGGKDEVI